MLWEGQVLKMWKSQCVIHDPGSDNYSILGVIRISLEDRAGALELNTGSVAPEECVCCQFSIASKRLLSLENLVRVQLIKPCVNPAEVICGNAVGSVSGGVHGHSAHRPGKTNGKLCSSSCHLLFASSTWLGTCSIVQNIWPQHPSPQPDLCSPIKAQLSSLPSTG